MEIDEHLKYTLLVKPERRSEPPAYYFQLAIRSLPKSRRADGIPP